jgi:hypothetical protein
MHDDVPGAFGLALRWLRADDQQRPAAARNDFLRD